MLRLNKTVQINPNFSWIDWGLYDMYGCVGVADALNSALRLSVNDGESRTSVEKHMYSYMELHRRNGADDTEAHEFLSQVLDNIFGE